MSSQWDELSKLLPSFVGSPGHGYDISPRTASTSKYIAAVASFVSSNVVFDRAGKPVAYAQYKL